MRAPNTSADVYHAGHAPPSAPDLGEVQGHLRESWQRGLAVSESHPAALWTATFDVPLDTDLRDGWPGLPAPTVYIPNRDGQKYTVVFVERRRQRAGGDFKRVYLRREASIVAINIREADGSPSLTSVHTLIVDQDTALGLSQPAAGQALLQLASASDASPGIVTGSAQILGRGLKQFLDDLWLSDQSNQIQLGEDGQSRVEQILSGAGFDQVILRAGRPSGYTAAYLEFSVDPENNAFRFRSSGSPLSFPPVLSIQTGSSTFSDGQTTTVDYLKPDSSIGTLTFNGGILTGVS